MDVTSLYITDNNFDKKVKELKTMLRLRMNGETSSQMNKRNLKYTINYGVALPHIKEIASRVNFTHEECKKLWLMNIRETMLLACMLMPSEKATTQELLTWIEKIQTPDMAEQASFFLFSRVDNAEEIALKAIELQSEYALATAYFTLGRALQTDKTIADNTLQEALKTALKTNHYNSAELRGLSLLMRQCIRKRPQLNSDIDEILKHLETINSPSSQAVIYEVKIEKEL